ncbi:hypothetical protein FGLOB1_14708 [Fusarium globosum]|uniref:Uncharacterized protein n=1 Tax=Fusarium globosum TaxID=78864 RepID=A0A8H5XA00_9HYPO|nr:hypothetical protein FGLOB1_14708 [Fusarium globosum]
MSFPNLRTIHPLSKNNDPPVGTKDKKQGSSTLKHMPTEEQDPLRPGNIPTNLNTIAVDGGDRTDHTQRHRETGDQSQWSWEDVNGTCTILMLVQDNDAKLVPVASSSSAPPRNRFLDNDGDLILPTVQELYEMTDSDKEEWQGARALFYG